MKQLEQTYTIKAQVSEIWKALTDGPMAEQWGAGPAKVDPRVGGEFSYWGGDIHVNQAPAGMVLDKKQ